MRVHIRHWRSRFGVVGPRGMQEPCDDCPVNFDRETAGIFTCSGTTGAHNHTPYHHFPLDGAGDTCMASPTNET